MTKIPIITQNFSSPDVYTDTPLMLLPQAPPPPLPDRDQEGFSQLLLHDLHRHRQSYVRSYTAFETLKKRQDFVLRQENLRSLQSFEQRIHIKQDQFLDQSIHSYEQCFVKVINGNLNTNGNVHESHKRRKSAAPSFDKYHSHQLSHISATALDPPPVTSFHRYQKSHRPPKYPSQTSLYRSAQSFHDAFQSSSFVNHNQPFLSFTENYLQKYVDRSSSRLHLPMNHAEMEEIREKQEEEEEEGEQKQQQTRSASVEPNHLGNKNKKHDSKAKASDLQRSRATISSRNTNTPSSTPQMGYHDAIRDGLTALKDNDDHSEKIPPILEKRRSSQQSTSQPSNSDGSTGIKRPKTGKKKQVVVNITPDTKNEPIASTKPLDSDLFKSAMFVQNYDTNTSTTTAAATSNTPAKGERPSVSVNVIRKAPSILRRSSVKSIDNNVALKETLDNIDTQMKTDELLGQINIDNNNKETLVPPTTTTAAATTVVTIQDHNEPQPPRLKVPENRKQIRKGAFDSGESMNDLVAFELGLTGSNRGAMRKNRFRSGKESNQNDEGLESVPENQATLDLIEKIRQSSTGVSIGQPPVSQQGCRFELPFDLKLLEQLTPLEYLSKYCRLSSRRTYQFKRIFDKYRNNQYRFESSNLYSAILDVHTEMFTRTQYETLCQLIDLGNEQHQFTFDTFGGILALSERMLCDSSRFRIGLDDPELAKDVLEKCDFDSLDRKFAGLQIRETMKSLLKTL